MQMYRLATLYRHLHSAARRGDLVQAHAATTEAIAVGLPIPTPNANAALAPELTYRGFKPAELAVLTAGIKQIVKFEDIPVATAERFISKHSKSYDLIPSAPYTKDYLLLRSAPADATHPAALITIYASRTDAGRRLYDLERSDPTDVYGAGELLEIPECCVNAFAVDAARSRVDQDTINDDACKRVLTSVPNGTGHPALDPLSDLELLGFYPCTLLCKAAIARAELVGRALAQLAPSTATKASEQLGRSTLFFRLPFFARLSDGATASEEVAVVNALPDKTVRQIQTLFAQSLSTFTTAADTVRVETSTDSTYLVALSAAGETARVRCNNTAAPVLAHYQPWPDNFFDPA